MRSIRILTTVFSFAAGTLAAQPDTLRSGIGFGLGFNSQSLKSEVFSPMVHSGLSLGLQLTYRREFEKRREHTQLNYDSYSLTSEIEGMTTTGKQGLFQTAMHWRIGKGARSIQFFGGGVVDAHISYRNNLYNGMYLGNNTTGEVIASLSPSIFAERNVGKNRVNAQVWIAVFSYIIKPGYANSNPPDRYFASFEKIFRTQARISYILTGQRVDGRLDGQLEYFNLSKDQQTRFLNYGVIASLVYKLK